MIELVIIVAGILGITVISILKLVVFITRQIRKRYSHFVTNRGSFVAKTIAKRLAAGFKASECPDDGWVWEPFEGECRDYRDPLTPEQIRYLGLSEADVVQWQRR